MSITDKFVVMPLNEQASAGSKYVIDPKKEMGLTPNEDSAMQFNSYVFSPGAGNDIFAPISGTYKKFNTVGDKKEDLVKITQVDKATGRSTFCSLSNVDFSASFGLGAQEGEVIQGELIGRTIPVNSDKTIYSGLIWRITEENKNELAVNLNPIFWGAANGGLVWEKDLREGVKEDKEPRRISQTSDSSVLKEVNKSGESSGTGTAIAIGLGLLAVYSGGKKKKGRR